MNVASKIISLAFAALMLMACGQQKPSCESIPLIFDTDLGNDVDDAIALGLLFNYAEEGRIDILAEGISKNGEAPAEYMDILNCWYGYPDIPVGIVRNGADCESDALNYAKAVATMTNKDGKPLFGRTAGKDYSSLPDAHILYRKILSQAEDASVVFVTVGFSTNIARLLDTPSDDYSPLTGKELVKQKVKRLVMMAGCFNGDVKSEYNVWKDIPSARKVIDEWDSEIVLIPFELGIQVCYPAESIENDFNEYPFHPVVEAYKAYLPMPYDRPLWDPAALVYAVEGNEWFAVSPLGRISLNEEGTTLFKEDTSGKHRYLMTDPEKAGKLTNHIVKMLTNSKE